MLGRAYYYRLDHRARVLLLVCLCYFCCYFFCDCDVLFELMHTGPGDYAAAVTRLLLLHAAADLVLLSLLLLLTLRFHATQTNRASIKMISAALGVALLAVTVRAG